MKTIVKLCLLPAIAFLSVGLSSLQPSSAQNSQTQPPAVYENLPPPDQRIFSPEDNPSQSEEQKELELEQQINDQGNPDGMKVQETPAPVQIYQDNVPTTPESEIQLKNP
jgi:hypothetical protein